MCLIDTDGKECWRLSKASSTIPELFIQDSLEVLWITSDRRRAWIHLDRSLAVVDLATGRALSASELIAQELGQCAGDVSCLLRAAYRLRLPPPPSLLHRADPPGKFLQLGWRARLGEAKAQANLQLAARRGETGVLEGLAVLGPQTVRAALVNAMLNGQSWPLLSGLHVRPPDDGGRPRFGLHQIAGRTSVGCGYLKETYGDEWLKLQTRLSDGTVVKVQAYSWGGAVSEPVTSASA